MYKLLAVVLALTVVSCGGGGGDSQPATLSRPPAPTNVSAEGGKDSIVVRWTASANATQYNMYWSEASGVSAQNGNKVTATGQQGVLYGLNDDTIYYVVVTAENSGGESSESAEAQAQPVLTIPGAVTGISVTPGNSTVKVKWNPQLNADSYTIFVGTSYYDRSLEFTVATSPFDVTGLTNGVTYFVGVAANNEAGQGQYSLTFGATPIAPVPGWTPQTQINTPPICPYSPQGCGGYARIQDFSINENGVAAVLWSHDEGVGYPAQLAVNHTASGTWGEQYILDGNLSGHASIAITPNGDMHVAHSRPEDIFLEECGYRGVSRRIWWRRYRAGGWSNPVAIESDNQGFAAFFVRLASDDQGNIFATWVETEIPLCASWDAQTAKLWTRRFDAVADSWGDAVRIGESVSGIVYPTIATGPSNQAFVAWLQDTAPYDPDYTGPGLGPDRRVVYASRYDGVQWQPGAIVGRNDLVDWDTVSEFTLDVNSTGSAVITWVQSFSSTSGSLPPDSYQAGAARYDTQLGQWSAPESILDSTNQVLKPDVAINASNQSVAAWRIGVNGFVDSSRYDTDTNLWGAVNRLPTGVISLGGDYGVEADGAGAFILAWTSGRDQQGLLVSRLEPGSPDWSDGDIIGGLIAPNSRMQIKAHRSGHAIIVNEHIGNTVIATIYSPQ